MSYDGHEHDTPQLIEKLGEVISDDPLFTIAAVRLRRYADEIEQLHKRFQRIQDAADCAQFHPFSADKLMDTIAIIESEIPPNVSDVELARSTKNNVRADEADSGEFRDEATSHHARHQSDEDDAQT
jgi:hypothetical protein